MLIELVADGWIIHFQAQFDTSNATLSIHALYNEKGLPLMPHQWA